MDKTNSKTEINEIQSNRIRHVEQVLTKQFDASFKENDSTKKNFSFRLFSSDDSRKFRWWNDEFSEKTTKKIEKNFLTKKLNRWSTNAVWQFSWFIWFLTKTFLQSTVVSFLLCFSSMIFRGLIITVTHLRQNQARKISSFIGQEGFLSSQVKNKNKTKIQICFRKKTNSFEYSKKWFQPILFIEKRRREKWNLSFELKTFLWRQRQSIFVRDQSYYEDSRLIQFVTTREIAWWINSISIRRFFHFRSDEQWI